MKDKKNKQTWNREGVFRSGRAGCESRLYEVRGYFPGTMKGTDFLELTKEEQREKFDILKIAANDVPEVLKYVQRWKEDFDVREVVLIGLIIMLSGTPHHA